MPSGTERAPKAQLLLGAGAVIYPPKLLQEIATHHVDTERLSIDPRAMIIEDEDVELEKAMLDTISSTAQGVGAASARKIMGRGGKTKPAVRLAEQITELKPFIRDSHIALTFIDYLGIANRNAFRFDQLSLETLRFVEEVERVSGVRSA